MMLSNLINERLELIEKREKFYESNDRYDNEVESKMKQNANKIIEFVQLHVETIPFEDALGFRNGRMPNS